MIETYARILEFEDESQMAILSIRSQCWATFSIDSGVIARIECKVSEISCRNDRGISIDDLVVGNIANGVGFQSNNVHGGGLLATANMSVLWNFTNAGG